MTQYYCNTDRFHRLYWEKKKKKIRSIFCEVQIVANTNVKLLTTLELVNEKELFVFHEGYKRLKSYRFYENWCVGELNVL